MTVSVPQCCQPHLRVLCLWHPFLLQTVASGDGSPSVASLEAKLVLARSIIRKLHHRNLELEQALQANQVTAMGACLLAIIAESDMPHTNTPT
jgi:hypothetical protein